MGLQCAKVKEPPKGRQHSNRQMPIEDGMSRIKEVAAFEIKINNLRLLNLTKSFHNIKIQLKQVFLFVLPYQDFYFQDHIFKSNHTYATEFEVSLQSLADRYVLIHLQQKSGRCIELLRIKVNQLMHGPVKHDHLLKELKSRLLFDLHIDQYVHTDVLVEHCDIKWGDASHHSDYTYFLSLIFSNCKSPIQTRKVFEKHEKIKELALHQAKIKNTQLADAIMRIRVVDNFTQDHIFDYFLPLSKLHQLNGFKTIRISQITYELRQFRVDQNIVLQDSSMGIIGLQVKFLKSKLYAQQMECVILSEEGIVMHTLSEHQIKNGSSSKSIWLKHDDLVSFSNRMAAIKHNGISQYDFYILLENIYVEIQDKHFAVTDQLFKNQQQLLNLLLLLSQFLQNDKELQNQYIWSIINYLCREPILKLKYFFSIKNQEEKIIFAKKFYQFILLIFKKIIKLTANGISFKQLISIHKFVAFAYFRLPWCQDQIISTLHKEGDPIISQQKLAEIGASYALKSPSKNYFYDWETSVFRLIYKDKELLGWIKQLNDAKRQNSWAKLLFDREYQQLFYSIYSQLWDQGQSFLNNNGKILWQYFPKYGELLSIFFGQMNSSKITDFSAQMTKCNMKLIKNEKLLTTFMMLIFPKTHLFETYCVIKCLNLIECYFNVILTNHKKLPYNFHYNYFYTGIKCILQSQHSYLLQKLLSILYKFYFIFNDQFKESINNFIINKVFFKLFLHWSQDVRNIFHLLVIFKIYQGEHHENPEIHLKKAKNSSDIQIKLHYQHIITSLMNRLEFQKQSALKSQAKTPLSSDFFQRMKTKLAKISRSRIKQRQSSILSEFEEASEHFANRKRSYIQNLPFIAKRKWSTIEQFQSDEIVPEQQELKYLSISLRDFEKAKRELKPDEKVQARSKMFQLQADQ